MPNKLIRKIVHIDGPKCNGCGACAIKCGEGALQIINGKAKLISENYCDGLGACLGECPQGAISIEERTADEFNESAVQEHLLDNKSSCPGETIQQFSDVKPVESQPSPMRKTTSLTHWPVQLTLVLPTAPFLKNANIILTADCVPCAYPNFHEDFLKGHVMLLACPKFDNFEAHHTRLIQILQIAKPASLTVVHMEVPCCSGLVYMAQQAVRESKTDLLLREVTIGIKGECKENCN
jgi:Pyruvate/2-oxoacid:ferredoxin oxidoreductase delta subunit